MVKSKSDRFRTAPLRQKKSRLQSSKSKVQIFWSIHPVQESLRNSSRKIKEIIVDEKAGTRIKNIVKLAAEKNVAVRYDNSLFRKGGLLAEERHQGIAARIEYPYVSLAEMLESLKNSVDVPFVLALDSIHDPRNLGAIIRSAVAAGCNKLILPKDRAAQISGTVAKASAGAVFHIQVCRVTNLATTIDALREAGIWVFGTSADGPLTIHQADFSGPVCLVIGNEEKGVRPLVKKHCDGLVSIPMAGILDSLNASVAAGVVLFEVARQRAK